MSYDLKGLSADALECLARHATALAKDLRREEPTIRLALEAGIVDSSYHTVRYGMVAEYRGTVEITLANGKRWRAIGHGPMGTAAHVSKEGWIEFIPLDDLK